MQLMYHFIIAVTLRFWE